MQLRVFVKTKFVDTTGVQICSKCIGQILCLDPTLCGMHTASDSTRRSRYTTRWFNTYDNTLFLVLEQARTQGGCPGCPGNHLFVLKCLIWLNENIILFDISFIKGLAKGRF